MVIIVISNAINPPETINTPDTNADAIIIFHVTSYVKNKMKQVIAIEATDQHQHNKVF